LSRPLTFIVMAILIAVVGVLAIDGIVTTRLPKHRRQPGQTRR
jgi:uncharacterized integral membrane protein